MQLPISLADRVNQSELIIEGEIISSQSKWNVERNMIFTVSQIRVFKLFKGSLSGSVVTLLTEGGQDGLDLIEVGNEFMPVVGEQGVFMLKMNSKIPNLAIRFQGPLYTCFMAHQSTVMYNLFDKTANSPFQQFNSIPYGLYPAIHQITGQYHTELITNTRLNQALQQTQSGNQVNAVPTITSFTPTTITAGTAACLPSTVPISVHRVEQVSSSFAMPTMEEPAGCRPKQVTTEPGPTHRSRSGFPPVHFPMALPPEPARSGSRTTIRISPPVQEH